MRIYPASGRLIMMVRQIRSDGPEKPILGIFQGGGEPFHWILSFRNRRISSSRSSTVANQSSRACLFVVPVMTAFVHFAHRGKGSFSWGETPNNGDFSCVWPFEKDSKEGCLWENYSFQRSTSMRPSFAAYRINSTVL